MIFRPTTLAAGWRSVALAASKDKDRPILTGVLVEQYAEGLRLVATDSYMALHAFVPSLEAEIGFDPEPLLDESPIASCIVADPDGRGRGLLAYAAQLAAKDNLGEIRVDLGVIAHEDEDAPSFAGMEARWCVIEVSERERVKLRLIEGEYPAWRALFAGHEAEETKNVALNLELLARLSKLPKITGCKVLRWEFHGETAAAAVTLDESFPHVSGLVMPCRWDVYDNKPEPPEDDPTDGMDPLETSTIESDSNEIEPGA